MAKLQLLAGSVALKKIQDHGLNPEDICALFGASGAAKWLTIYGLDKAIFTQWLVSRTNPLPCFGTSIGAMKLAAATQRNPADALTRLAEAYITQSYEDDISIAAIVRETDKILGRVLGETGIAETLSNKHLLFNCGAVRCKKQLTSDNANIQKLTMVKAALASLISRKHLRKYLSRAMFTHPDSASFFRANDNFSTEYHVLTEQNFRAALLASGSIPVLMHGVRKIPGCEPHQVYRDGGLLDYHPVPSNLCQNEQDIILYPHFYPVIRETWFDKFYKWKKVSPERMKNVLIVAPSAEYVETLPNGSIPDRKDFVTYAGEEQTRMLIWREAMNRSKELGEEWLKLAQQQQFSAVVKPLTG